MTNFMNAFIADESGAVTVDWVVLTAALVGLGLAVMAVVSGGVEDLSNDIDGQLVGMGIDTTFDGTGALQSNVTP
jgi:Flp pilus assembly pilin Flp